MAENGESGGSEDRDDLSDEASPYRLEEMREQGKVAQSRELAGMFSLFAAFVTIYTLMQSGAGEQFMGYLKDVLQSDIATKMDVSHIESVNTAGKRALKMIFILGVPVSLAGFVLGIVGSVSQIGFIFTTEPLTPDWSRLNPITGLQRMFSMKQAIEMLRILVKMVIMVAAGYFLLKSEVFHSPQLLLADLRQIPVAYSEGARVMFFSLGMILLVFAGADWWMIRREYMKSARLTKQEAKQEHKEHEGDPLIKSRVRAIQREAARRRMMNAVKKADLVVTNPTHIAVALVYDHDKMAAPKVVAKGADFMAQKIKKIAAENGVPLVENVPLARTLFKTVKVGQNIPRALYAAVAEVLAYVYKLKNRRL